MNNSLNQRDLAFGGIAAYARALNCLADRLAVVERQTELLEVADAQRAQRVAQLELAVGALASRLDDLEYLVSMEVMAGLIPEGELHEVAAELRDGWQIRLVRVEGAGQREVVEELGAGWRVEREVVAAEAGTVSLY